LAFVNMNALRSDLVCYCGLKVFGVPGFLSSITIVHEFFSVFRVTSMLYGRVSKNSAEPQAEEAALRRNRVRRRPSLGTCA
jgi:hypothetical protein